MEGVTIRKFRKEDAVKVSNVVRKAQWGALTKVYPKKLIEAFCRKHSPSRFINLMKERDYFVAEDRKKRKLLGAIALKGNEVKTFFVDPKYHGRGIGRKLFERVKKEALKKGYKRMTVMSTHFACPIYKKFGFKRIGIKRVEIEGIKYTDIIMELRLPKHK